MKRNTVQRQIILETVQKLGNHPTVDEVYMEVHQKHPTISKVTVYRDLRQLSDDHAIQQVLLPGDLERYDTRVDHHYHFKCKECGALFDVDIDDVGDMDKEVREKYGFEVDTHDVVFHGVCPACQQKKKKSG